MTTRDTAAIAELIVAPEAGWNRHDGDRFTAPFTEDADFAAMTGLRAHGREIIGRGHAELIAPVFRGTRLTANILGIPLVHPDDALAEAHLHLSRTNGQPYPVGPSLASIVAVRAAGKWVIAALRNMVSSERAATGPVEREMTPVEAQAV